jgi:hypothetical protein
MPRRQAAGERARPATASHAGPIAGLHAFLQPFAAIRVKPSLSRQVNPCRPYPPATLPYSSATPRLSRCGICHARGARRCSRGDSEPGRPVGNCACPSSRAIEQGRRGVNGIAAEKSRKNSACFSSTSVWIPARANGRPATFPPDRRRRRQPHRDHFRDHLPARYGHRRGRGFPCCFARFRACHAVTTEPRLP